MAMTRLMAMSWHVSHGLLKNVPGMTSNYDRFAWGGRADPSIFEYVQYNMMYVWDNTFGGWVTIRWGSTIKERAEVFSRQK